MNQIVPAQISARDAAQAGPAAPADVRTAIDDVLAGSEFRRGESALDRLMARVGEFLRDLLPDGVLDEASLATLAQVLVWVLLAAVVALVVWVAVRSLRTAREPDVEPDAPAPAVARARRVARLRAEAREADARGEHVLALRLEFTALVVGLGEKGDLEYRDAFTNRELLERGKPGRAAAGVLSPLVVELDRKSFGGEPASHEDFARMSGLCDRLLGGARA